MKTINGLIQAEHRNGLEIPQIYNAPSVQMLNVLTSLQKKSHVENSINLNFTREIIF